MEGKVEGKEVDKRILNVNVGILGHIDSGKTSLVRALSTHLSTAALDKHPQSQERGITLDLGFSAFQVDMPSHLPNHSAFDKLQFTLVDCPGHASLIRTIITGAQIIDVMVLVIDVTKGVQTQTAECLIVGEISPCKSALVVLNKIDLLPAATRESQIGKMTKRLRATFKGTKFADGPMAPVAARPAGPEGEPAGGARSEGIQQLVSLLVAAVPELERSKDGPFIYAVDHCFPIRGQGSVMTGTVLQGSIGVGQPIEIPALKLQRKVKSMQMFHRPVTTAAKGDRVGLCVTQLDTKLLERGLVGSPGALPTSSGVLALVRKIPFFRGRVASKSKLHVSIGHTTAMAEVLFFAAPQPHPHTLNLASATGGQARLCPDPGFQSHFDFSHDYSYQDELAGEPSETSGSLQDAQSSPGSSTSCWALLRFESPVSCPPHSLFIASRLDTDIHTNTCRLAFYGRLVALIDPAAKEALQMLRIYKWKHREGSIERYVDAHTAIGRGLFKKETDFTVFVGLRVRTASGAIGVIQSSFGKSGKFKIYFEDGVEPPASNEAGGNKLFLDFKRYIFDPTRKIVQS